MRTPNNHSLRQSNPQVIPDEHKQTSARHASKKTIQRPPNEIREDNFVSSRNTKTGSISIRCQMDEELRRRQLANKTVAKNKTHRNDIEDDAPITLPPAPSRHSSRHALPQLSRPNTLMWININGDYAGF